MPNPLVHFDIGCRDMEKTREFYVKLFHWKTEPYGPSSVMVDTGSDQGIGGAITALGHEPHNYVMIYVQVEDLQATLDRVEALGGKTRIPPTPVPGSGDFAWFVDPEGNLIGLWKPAR